LRKMLNFIGCAVAGLFSGLHSSCWGAYKDSLYERFKILTFSRSIIVGFLLGIILFVFLKFIKLNKMNFGLFFVFVMAFERLFTESFKAFVREEKQEKYRIPSKLHIFGRVVQNRGLRWIIGIAFIMLAFLLLYLPQILNISFKSNFIEGVFWGFIAGLFGSALGGMWKDAPIEGFYPLKFLRSPAVGAVFGGIFSLFTSNYSFLLFSCIGAERMTVEFYKTFMTKNPPGKFKSKNPKYKDWIEKRKIFILPYFLTWVVFIIMLFLSKNF
jgi:hypothetical protein